MKFTRMDMSMGKHMNKTGFIGFGAMGGIMVEALARARAIPEDQIILTTRTPDKMKDFLVQHRKVEAVNSIKALAEKCGRIIVCTGTNEVKAVLEEIGRYASKDVHIITITGLIEMACLESIWYGSITRIMPTQLAAAGQGMTLVIHNAKVLPADRAFISEAFSKIGKVKEISEAQMDLAADLSSCAPAFYAAIIKAVTGAAQRHGGMPPEAIRDISLATMGGTVKLIAETGLSFDELINRVATPGGITEEGVKILERTLPPVFDEVLTATMSKRTALRARTREQYGIT
jgi:pyrroline-5-carboxylate reductase